MRTIELSPNRIPLLHGDYIDLEAPTMPVSTHSHSGQFCAHASNTLEEMVQAAIAKEMRVYALTEHMPRGPEDLYPEEASKSFSGSSYCCKKRKRKSCLSTMEMCFQYCAFQPLCVSALIAGKLLLSRYRQRISSP